jgi:hypothetical protein
MMNTPRNSMTDNKYGAKLTDDEYGVTGDEYCSRLVHTMGAKSIARLPPKVLNFEILELLTK